MEIALTLEQSNTMMNAVNNYNPFAPASLALFPTLNLDQMDWSYDEIMTRPFHTILPVYSSTNWRIFFYRANQVYKIVTDAAITRVQDVDIVRRSQAWVPLV